MPELPEVETIKQQLEKAIVGRVIKDVDVREKRQFLGEPKNIINGKIIGLDRRAKILLIYLDNDFTLVIHLKMTGQLIWQSKILNRSIPSEFKSKIYKNEIIGGHPDKSYNKPSPHQYTRIIFTFDDGSRLFFNDLRKFGWMAVARRATKLKSNHAKGRSAIWAENEKVKIMEDYIDKLGVEPLSKDFTIEKLTEIIKKYPKQKIKTLLMNQELIAGIGNIYSDEILFASRIMPTRLAKTLSKNEIKLLFSAIPQILQKAIRFGGTSRSNYLKPDGSRGGYMDEAMVYGRKGLPCRVCGAIIKTIKINGRTGHYCSVCQK
ncbi:MAG: formamidopyrimidine-DNA glycosidase [Candidatus Berkelbacteria bacterium Licking1014_2]|uniref:Formamidopyrimidine-DNA glycosidase n=1 Tax=Candidatus Berkelbacteria bacterium Licking1014_2 TaxID=2017146 RepID=A0A554LTP1_9BACT|nr:MAG: formamidopyrimidine-DNA glycosidase [Candidatus Berkelbacteria bacterium Licking1014_2]